MSIDTIFAHRGEVYSDCSPTMTCIKCKHSQTMNIVVNIWLCSQAIISTDYLVLLSSQIRKLMTNYNFDIDFSHGSVAQSHVGIFT